jgi:hypothetical protein
MKTELLLAGVACVVAAAVGGGLKLLGAEFPLLGSTRRQVLLAGIGVALVAWGWATPSEQAQQRTAALQQQRRDLAIELSRRLERIGTDLNRRWAGQEVPGLIEGNDIPALTDAYQDLVTNRPTLGDDLYKLLRQKADLALQLANVRTADEKRQLGAKWVSANEQLNERLG